MSNKIHSTAIIDPDARLGDNITVGPYTVIESGVEIGDNVFIDAHVKIARYTKIGARTRVYYGALIGEEPQDHRCCPGIVAPTLIGSDTVIREYVTIHRSPFEDAPTSVGDNTLLMAFVHLGHDARIGNRVTIANHTAVSGHVHIEDGAVISGYVKMHQFCRIGAIAMIGADTIITQDVPPYCMMPENNFICGPNTIGLRRNGLVSDARAAIRRAVKCFFFKGLNAKNAVCEIKKEKLTPEVEHFIKFVTSTERGIMSGDPKLVSLGG